MVNAHPRYEIWLFLGPAFVHFTWGVVVLMADAPLVTTGLADINKLMGNHNQLTGTVLILFSLMAFASIVLHPSRPRLSFWMLLPQQFMMLLSLITAAECMVTGTFANGVVLGSDFIIADQCHQFFVPAAHSGLIIHVYWKGLLTWIKTSWHFWVW